MITAPATTATEQAALPRLKMSWEEFLAWVDEDSHAEWVDGEVSFLYGEPTWIDTAKGHISMPSPAAIQHQAMTDFLFDLLRYYLLEKPIGKALREVMVRLPDRPSGRQPDILVVLNERIKNLTKTYLDGPADLVVEIISPESESRDRGEKFVEYEAAGIPEYWLVDPLREAAMFYRLDERSHYQLVPLDDEGCFHCAVLPGLRLNPSWLWQEPLPNLAETLELVRGMLK